MRKNKVIRTIIASFLCLAMMSAAVVFTTEPADAASWINKFKTLTKGDMLGKKSYRGLQGLGFDTYSGKDGYCFVENTKGSGMQLMHITINSKGKCKKVKTVTYSRNNVGHANDATVYQDPSGAKWLFFAPHGTVDEPTVVRATNGSELKVGAIRLSDYNSGNKTVHSCRFNGVFGSKMLYGNISGITYIGMRTITVQSQTDATTGSVTKTVPMFVLLGGSKMVQAYLTQDNGALTFNAYGLRARFEKKPFSNGSAVGYQGIAYHKGYIYICGEGKNNSVVNTMMIGSIYMGNLFNGSDSSEKHMDFCQKKIKKDGKKKLSKNGPEAVFFTNLDGNSKLYLSVNRRLKKGGKDVDAIIRSTASF